jgi:c(7)-type cytochrome triheme protein
MRLSLKSLAALLIITATTLFSLKAVSSAAKILPPDEYGMVVISNYSKKAGLAPVVFDHWLHRAMYTCRLCHVDIGFSMEAGGTKIKAEHNSKGFYCGSCHNGRRSHNKRVIFGACPGAAAQDDRTRCDRCHSLGREVKRDYEFDTFIKDLPRQVLGNRVDWEEAEEKGLIKPVDYLEGISVKRSSLAVQKDFSIGSKVGWMSDVTFSHKKHAVWNGCEVCHPEIFPSVKKGTVKYSMFEIYAGEYCGVCHDKVAFPLLDCSRCHTKPVQ